MKPRTKLEKEVWALHEQLPSLTSEQLEWGFAQFGQTAYFRRRKGYAVGRFRCTECGHEWSGQMTQETRCPQCGKQLNVEESKAVNREKFGFNVYVSQSGKWMVFRYVYHYYKIDMRGIDRYAAEVMQIWRTADGKEVVLARPRNQYSWRTKSIFSMWANMSVYRPQKSAYYYSYSYDVREIDYKAVHPTVPKPFSYVDWSDDKFNGAHIVRIMSAMMKHPIVESLIKADYLDLLRYFLRDDLFDGKDGEAYLNAARLVMKTHYKVSDYPNFIDYLKQVVMLNMDWHNPTIVCPDDLDAAHQRLTARINRERDKMRYEQEKEKIMKAEKAYQKMRKPFFGFVIADGNIQIQVLKSVDDFYKEGTEMHHCVYACGYYKNRQSLILSARQGEDWDNPQKTLETVEVNLNNFSIVQSRGHCNGQSNEHERIVKLVNENMPKIKQIWQQQQTQLAAAM